MNDYGPNFGSVKNTIELLLQETSQIRTIPIKYYLVRQTFDDSGSPENTQITEYIVKTQLYPNR
jgi:hypothetical protein